jgi:PAS domain S-box-containing protein
MNIGIPKRGDGAPPMVGLGGSEAERQLRMYEAVLSNTPDFVYVFSLDHKILYANDALIKMWGRGRDGAIGKTFLEIGYEPWHAEMHCREIDEVRATRQPVRGEVPFTGTHGRRMYDYIFVPVIGADGEVEAVAGTTRDVTERKEAEQRLRASEDRQALLVKLADTLRPLSDPIDIQAEASRVLGEHLRANRVLYFEIRGDEYVIERDYTAGVRPLAGKYPVDAFGPDLLARLLAGRTVIEADAITLERPRGEQEAFAAIQVRGHVDVPLVKRGQFVAGVSVHVSDRRDWSSHEVALIEETAERTWASVERARAEAALRASEQGRWLALDAAELGTFNIDPTTDTLTSDERFRIIFARTAEAMDYEQAFAAIHPEDQARIRQAVEAALRPADPIPYVQEYRVVHPDGSVHWVFAKGRATFAGEGSARRPTSFDGTISDITARKEAEASLKESEERFRLMADAAPVMIWMSGTDKRVSWYNKPWLAFTGRSMDQEVGDGATEIVHPDDLDRSLQVFTSAFDARAPFTIESRLRRHDGEFRWMISNGVPRYRVDGGFEGYIGSCFDVTDYKNAQAALRDADRRKDEFLATLSHELRNPLAPIRNGLQIIRLAGATGTIEQARMMMERQLGQMVRLVDDLLDVSRVTTGKLVLRPARIDLKTVIEAALETTRSVIEQAGHELSVVVPDVPIFVEGDATRLAQVVSNLLNNSAKYTSPGGHIRLRAGMENGMAILAVQDDGIGIPSNMLGGIFEMFTQVDRTLEKSTGGLGIGLSLAKGLVEMHGGTIDVRSDVGHGSEFIVRLPAVRHTAQTAGQPEEVAATATHRRRILVADDNVDAADSLRQVLELLGNEVTTANDGMEAVEVAEAFRPELIMLDIGMPKLNGYQACRRIRELDWGKRATIIAMTGWGQDEDKRQALETGFDQHLVKPVDTEALEKLLVSLHPSSG